MNVFSDLAEILPLFCPAVPRQLIPAVAPAPSATREPERSWPGLTCSAIPPWRRNPGAEPGSACALPCPRARRQLRHNCRLGPRVWEPAAPLLSVSCTNRKGENLSTLLLNEASQTPGVLCVPKGEGYALRLRKAAFQISNKSTKPGSRYSRSITLDGDVPSAELAPSDLNFSWQFAFQVSIWTNPTESVTKICQKFSLG